MLMLLKPIDQWWQLGLDLIGKVNRNIVDLILRQLGLFVGKLLNFSAPTDNAFVCSADDLL